MGKHLKAFTLAELMGVIVVLGILAVIIVPVVDRNLKKGKNVTCKTQEKTIIEAAKNCVSDGKCIDSSEPNNNCEEKGGSCQVKIIELVEDGYLEGADSFNKTSPINPATGESYDGATYVSIYNETGHNYSYTLVYAGKDSETCKEWFKW